MSGGRAAAAVVLAVLGALAACSGAPDDLGDGVLLLPNELREVSGIVAVDATTLACVQDERGAVWFVDVAGRTPLRRVAFGPDGDYEALARDGDRWWVLRSDGWLACVAPRGGALAIVATATLPQGRGEWEALCADPERSRLLAVPKRGSPAAGGGGRRPVFAVELPAGKVVAEPVLVLDRDHVLARAADVGLVLPMTKGARRAHPRLELAISDLLVVAGSGDLLVLCAGDALLLRFDRGGRLVGGRSLDAELLPQAEGLAVLPDGRLVIASEGRGGTARVAVVPMP
jgi:hypothetical protein